VSAERLQKVLASAGIASRRDCEELITAGRVTVNGRIVRELGTRVDIANDQVAVDGALIHQPSEWTYIMLHKPVGVVTTVDDPQGRPTVMDLVSSPIRLFPVGRLDVDSEGLLLLTNDGELTHHLTHPGFAVEKEYRALLDQAPSASALRSWRTGVVLDSGQTAPAWVEVQDRSEAGAWVRVVLHEGRKRQIREVAQLLGYAVKRLIRVREGNLTLEDLPVGAWRVLRPEEIQELRAHAKLMGATQSGSSASEPGNTKQIRNQEHSLEETMTQPKTKDQASPQGEKRKTAASTKPAPGKGEQERPRERSNSRDRKEHTSHSSLNQQRSKSRASRDDYGNRQGRDDYGNRQSRNDYGNRQSRNDDYGNRQSRNDDYGNRQSRDPNRKERSQQRGERRPNERYAEFYPRGGRRSDSLRGGRRDDSMRSKQRPSEQRQENAPREETRYDKKPRGSRSTEPRRPDVKGNETGNTRTAEAARPVPDRKWRARQDAEARARQNRVHVHRSGRSAFRSRVNGRSFASSRPNQTKSNDDENES
jgi:23S rRNA pseudouridine2605 synthase